MYLNYDRETSKHFYLCPFMFVTKVQHCDYDYKND